MRGEAVHAEGVFVGEEGRISGTQRWPGPFGTGSVCRTCAAAAGGSWLRRIDRRGRRCRRGVQNRLPRRGRRAGPGPAFCMNGWASGSRSRPVAHWAAFGPTSSTIPIASWPRMSPGSRNGPRTSYRSEPQMPVEAIRTITSSGCSMTGSGTVSTPTSRQPARPMHACCSPLH